MEDSTMETNSWRVGRSFSLLAGACAIAWLTAAGCAQSAPSDGEDPSQDPTGGAGDGVSGSSAGSTGTTGTTGTGTAGTGQNGAGGSNGVGGQGSGGDRPGSGGSLATGGSAGSSGTAGTAVVGADAGRPKRTAPLRIMPFGDSITTSTCYRAKLAGLLDVKHKGDYDFVGTQKSGGCNIVDQDNEGHGGYIITQHTAEFAAWGNANTIDVLLLHFATNDCWNSIAPAKILDAYALAVAEFRKHNPYAVILVAQLIPLFPTGCNLCPVNVQNFNATIPDWAKKTTTATSPVIVVDEWTGYDAIADNRDGVHPNDTTGSVKMATKWAEALEPLF
jgi:hypothetical protein